MTSMFSFNIYGCQHCIRKIQSMILMEIFTLNSKYSYCCWHSNGKMKGLWHPISKYIHMEIQIKYLVWIHFPWPGLSIMHWWFIENEPKSICLYFMYLSSLWYTGGSACHIHRFLIGFDKQSWILWKFLLIKLCFYVTWYQNAFEIDRKLSDVCHLVQKQTFHTYCLVYLFHEENVLHWRQNFRLKPQKKLLWWHLK